MSLQRNNTSAITQIPVFKTVNNTTQAFWQIKYISPYNFY